MKYNFIKIADLASELDAENRIAEADALDEILYEIGKINLRLAKIDPAYQESYLMNSVEFSNVANKLRIALDSIDNQKSKEITASIMFNSITKEAGPVGSFMSGLVNTLKSPFSGVTNWFSGLIAGGQFKNILDHTSKNLGRIKALFSRGNFEAAKKELLNDIGMMLNFLKSKGTDTTRTTIPQQEGQTQAEQPQESTPVTAQIQMGRNVPTGPSGQDKLTFLLGDLYGKVSSSDNPQELAQAADIWTDYNSELNSLDPDRPKDLAQGFGGGGMGSGAGWGGAGWGGAGSGGGAAGGFEGHAINRDTFFRQVANAQKLMTAARRLIDSFPSKYPQDPGTAMQLAMEDAKLIRQQYNPRSPHYLN